MDKQIVYVHTKDYYASNEKKQIAATCNISKYHRLNGKQKKSDTKEYIVWFLHIKFKNRHN